MFSFLLLHVKFAILFLFTLLVACPLFAQQVGIGTAAPDPSAKLQIDDANRGVILPRVSLSDVTNATTPVNTPAEGVLVYNTNAAVTGGNGTGYYYWNGSQWQRLMAENADAWSLTGNAGTTAGTNYLGTSDARDLVFGVNGTEEMRILTTGEIKVGPVVSSPLQRQF